MNGGFVISQSSAGPGIFILFLLSLSDAQKLPKAFNIPRLSQMQCLVCMYTRCVANILFQMLAYLHWH